jgi:hypothetical protein
MLRVRWLLESHQTWCFLFTLLGSGKRRWATAGTLDRAAADVSEKRAGNGNSFTVVSDQWTVVSNRHIA